MCPTWPSQPARCARRIERLSILESLDIKGYANEQMFRAQGFDLDPDDPSAAEACEASCGSFKDQVPVLAKALGLAIDRVGFRVEFAIADHDTDFGFMTLREGADRRVQGHGLGRAQRTLADRVQLRVEAR